MAFKGHSLRARIARAISALAHRWWWPRAVTLGVRTIVLDGTQVFLVRHTYLAGWYLPGGAVDRGESAESAAARELLEEGGLRADERPRLHGFFKNGRRDHVACYVIRRFSRAATVQSEWEIAETGFFPLDALPDGTSPATRARLAELVGTRDIAVDW